MISYDLRFRVEATELWKITLMDTREIIRILMLSDLLLNTDNALRVTLNH